MIMIIEELNKLVKSSIDEYLGFNCEEIFNVGDPIIFGGAVRDSINKDDINDIDIVCHPRTCESIIRLMEGKDWYIDKSKYGNIALNEIYKGIGVINLPINLTNGDKVIQIIRPAGISLEEVISIVDISCCAVGFDGKGLREYSKNAIIHCVGKFFTINPKGMYDIYRTSLRSKKLLNKGWREINETDELKEVRGVKLNNIYKQIS